MNSKQVLLNEGQERYFPPSRVEMGGWLEELVHASNRDIQQKLGLSDEHYFDNCSNHEGYDFFYHSEGKLVAMEVKNLNDHYEISESWVKTNVFNKDRFIAADYVFVIFVGGRVAPSGLRALMNNSKVSFRHIPKMTIRSKDDQRNPQLIKRLRAVCWEAFEFTFGKFVYLLSYDIVPYSVASESSIQSVSSNSVPSDTYNSCPNRHS